MNNPKYSAMKAQGLQLFRSSQFDMAKVLYDQISQAEPFDFDSRFMLGVIAYKSGNNSESIEQLNAAIKIRENAPGALYQLAIVYNGSGDNTSAIDVLKKAIGYKPDYYDAYITLLKILSMDGKYSEIVKYYDEAIRVMPD
jgi:tetratricopeptide (TPR) repeat protein